MSVALVEPSCVVVVKVTRPITPAKILAELSSSAMVLRAGDPGITPVG
jgi:hypothetical protein